MSTRTTRTAGAALLGIALLLAGCGVPLQSQPQAIPANVLPAPLPIPSSAPAVTSTPSPTAPASPVVPTPRLRLWFVLEDGLAAVESDLPEGSGPDAVLVALAAGPEEADGSGPLRTIARDPLTGMPLVTLAAATDPEPSASAVIPSGPPPTPEPAPVEVRLSAAFSALPPGEQVLLLGQVVLSLTGAGAPAVAFTDDAGTPVAVPLPDGRLLDVPATARDYGSLIVQP